MTALLLSLLLCWDANTEPDLSHYRIRFAERYVRGYLPCPAPDDPDAVCPDYSTFAWAYHVSYAEDWQSPPCADDLGGVCFYQHVTAVDTSDNESVQPDLMWPPPFPGGCP